jgi:hypothetical protein
MTVNYEGQTTALPNARARLKDAGLEVTFSDQPLPCDESGHADGATTLSFWVPQGPKQKYFAGKPFGVPLHMHAGQKLNDPFALGAPTSRIQMDPFEPLPGHHLHGTLQATGLSSQIKAGDKNIWAYAAGGTFDATMCPDTRSDKDKDKDKLGPEPPSGDSGPLRVDDVLPSAPMLKGTVAGSPFTAASALALVFHDRSRNVDEIHAIELLPDASVTCATRTKASESLLVNDMGGAASNAPILGAPQPATAEHLLRTFSEKGAIESAPSQSLGNQAWVTFEKENFESGGTVTGTVTIVTRKSAPAANQASIAGHFKATVCRMGGL